MKKVLALAALALMAVGCGGPGPGNVAACKRMLAAAKCGSVDISGAYSCDTAYSQYPCDLAPYFDCVASHYVCTNGMHDQSKLQTLGADCQGKLVCR